MNNTPRAVLSTAKGRFFVTYMAPGALLPQCRIFKDVRAAECFLHFVERSIQSTITYNA